jgi:hypothetical protein
MRHVPEPSAASTSARLEMLFEPGGVHDIFMTLAPGETTVLGERTNLISRSDTTLALGS